MSLSWVAQAGLIELAFGALTGWLMVVVVEKPELLTRAGVRAPGRFRQAHLDYIIMGILLIAVGVAVPGLPMLWQLLIVGSAWLNPTLFVPMAFKPESRHHIAYKALATLSFLSMSGATVAAAVVGLGG